MADAQGTGSGASSSQGQGQTAGSTDWTREKARLEAELSSRDNQIRALSQVKQAWERNVGKELEGVVDYDSNGMPIGVTYDRQGQSAPQPTFDGNNPFSGLVDNPQNVDQYVQSLVARQGFITQEQANRLAQQAAAQGYQAARGDFMVLRNVDRLMGRDTYKDLSDYSSDMSKRTARIMSERQLGKPLDGAKGWDQWQYQTVDSLQLAADLARVEAFEESQRQQQATGEAQSNQGAAALSVGENAGTPGPGSDEWRKAVESGDSQALDEMMRKEVEQRSQQLGISV